MNDFLLFTVTMKFLDMKISLARKRLRMWTEKGAGRNGYLLRGYSLLELLLIMGIFIPVVVLLLLSMTQLFQRQALSSQTSEAALHVQKAMESLYSIAQTSQWDELIPSTDPYYLDEGPTGWMISTTPFDNVNFETKVFISNAYRNTSVTGDLDPTCTASTAGCVLDDRIRYAEVEVQWRTNPGRPVTAAGYISNLKYLLQHIPTMPPRPTSTRRPSPTGDPDDPDPTEPPEPTSPPFGPTNTPRPTSTPRPPRPTPTPFVCRWWQGDC